MKKLDLNLNHPKYLFGGTTVGVGVIINIRQDFRVAPSGDYIMSFDASRFNHEEKDHSFAATVVPKDWVDANFVQAGDLMIQHADNSIQFAPFSFLGSRLKEVV